MRARVICVTLALLAASGFPASLYAEDLRARAAAVNLTPVKWPAVVNGGFLLMQGGGVAVSARALMPEDAAAGQKPTSPPAGRQPVQLVQPRSPEETLRSIKVRDGYEVQLVAAEPLVMDPVAIAWGPDGKLWVAEMSDYPLGVDDKGKAGGRIRFLEDADGDGAFDKSTVLLEGVNFPTGVMPWRDGVLVTAAPEIFFAADRDGDGRAEVREPLYVGFTEGNTQLRVNGLKYGLDNWVYCANGWSSRDPVRSAKTREQVAISGRDLRIRPDEGAIQAETGMTEFGRDRDDWGNWFGCNNSYPVWHFVLSDRYTRRNPHVTPPEQTFMMTAGNPRVYPISREQKRYHSFEHAGHYTSACATTVYRDDLLFPRDGTTHHFICEPMHNVVQHLVSREVGATFTKAQRAPGEEKADFLASDDEWFRPVNLATGPDGALYVADMYRYMIEHPDWLPPQGQAEWKPYHRTGHDRGRIWRVMPKGQKVRPVPRLDKLAAPELAAALDSPNGWHRDTAQQLIVWRKDTAAIPKLQELLTSSQNPLARLHALCTLDGLGAITPESLERAMTDVHPALRGNAVRIAEPLAKANPSLIVTAAKLVEDPHAKVRLQLACSLGEWEGDAAGRALARLAFGSKDDPHLAAAVMSSAVPHFQRIVETWMADDQPATGLVYRQLLQMAVAAGDDEAQARLLKPVVTARSERLAPQMLTLAGWFDARAARGTNATPAAEWLVEHDLAPDHLVNIARSAVASTSAPPEERAAAAALLGRNPAEAELDQSLLAGLLKPQVPTDVQRAAIAALARAGGERLPGVLIGHWSALSPAVRVTAVDLLIGREPWAFELLRQIQAGKVGAGDVDVPRRQRLGGLKSARVNELAAKVFGEATDAARAKVVEAYAPSLKLTGDATRGWKTYAQNCAVCHKHGEQGNEIGPDLRSVRDWPAEAILANVLDPNRKAEPRYLAYTATLAGGDVLFGVITAETGSSLTIKGLDGKETTVLRADVKSLESTNRSLMPDGLEAALNKQQMADLIRFLKEPPEGAP